MQRERGRAIARLAFLSGLRNRAIFFLAGRRLRRHWRLRLLVVLKNLLVLVVCSLSAECHSELVDAARREVFHTHVLDVDVRLVRTSKSRTGPEVDGAVHPGPSFRLKKSRPSGPPAFISYLG